MNLGDMFACCETNSGSESMLELHERSGELAALLRLLHDTPLPPAVQPREKKSESLQFNPSTIIPLPLLKSLLSVTADKYALDLEIVRVLKAHLDAHARTDGLDVYGFASLHSLEWEACTASQYVLPLASYRFEEIKVIPSVIAYHKLVRLQDFRVKALRDLLLGEELFPHGYGKCQFHWEISETSWDRQRKALIGRIECVTDVAGEMDTLTDTFADCKACHKACIAAVEMLAYKCRRMPRRVDQIPNVY